MAKPIYTQARRPRRTLLRPRPGGVRTAPGARRRAGPLPARVERPARHRRPLRTLAGAAARRSQSGGSGRNFLLQQFPRPRRLPAFGQGGRRKRRPSRRAARPQPGARRRHPAAGRAGPRRPAGRRSDRLPAQGAGGRQIPCGRSASAGPSGSVSTTRPAGAAGAAEHPGRPQPRAGQGRIPADRAAAGGRRPGDHPFRRRSARGDPPGPRSFPAGFRRSGRQPLARAGGRPGAPARRLGFRAAGPGRGGHHARLRNGGRDRPPGRAGGRGTAGPPLPRRLPAGAYELRVSARAATTGSITSSRPTSTSWWAAGAGGSWFPPASSCRWPAKAWPKFRASARSTCGRGSTTPPAARWRVSTTVPATGIFRTPGGSPAATGCRWIR